MLVSSATASIGVNAAMQAAMFYVCAYPLPKFWHLPMLCNLDGKKMSKRDFGFGIQELNLELYGQNSAYMTDGEK